jgi:hypothetical protein
MARLFRNLDTGDPNTFATHLPSETAPALGFATNNAEPSTGASDGVEHALASSTKACSRSFRRVEDRV